jgi:Helix-turn-helix domain
MPPLTFDELHALPTVVDLMTAARALDIGRTTAYQLAKAGEFPVRIIRVGTAYHVPTAELLKLLGVGPTPQTDPPEASEQP